MIFSLKKRGAKEKEEERKEKKELITLSCKNYSSQSIFPDEILIVVKCLGWR